MLCRYNLALQCDKLNMFVCAACLNVNSDGALKLREKCDPKRFLLMELDLRKTASILHAERTILTLLSNDLSLGKIPSSSRLTTDKLINPVYVITFRIHHADKQCGRHVLR